jgi:hypothetical protein
VLEQPGSFNKMLPRNGRAQAQTSGTWLRNTCRRFQRGKENEQCYHQGSRARAIAPASRRWQTVGVGAATLKRECAWPGNVDAGSCAIPPVVTAHKGVNLLYSGGAKWVAVPVESERMPRHVCGSEENRIVREDHAPPPAHEAGSFFSIMVAVMVAWCRNSSAAVSGASFGRSVRAELSRSMVDDRSDDVCCP